MDLKATSLGYNEYGEHVYSVTDADEKQYSAEHTVIDSEPTEQAVMTIWPATEGGWGFTATGQVFGDVVSEHELVESGQQSYKTRESALAHGLAELTAFYHSDPDTI